MDYMMEQIPWQCDDKDCPLDWHEAYGFAE